MHLVRPLLAPPGRRVVDAVRRLRVALPVAIFLAVVAYEVWQANALAEPARLAAAVLFYGLVGPLVTFLSLDWIVRAVEAREAVEARAGRGERTLASITSGSADAIFSLDTEEVIQTWNRGAEEVFGYAADEVVGRHVNVLLPPAARLGGELARIRDRLYADGFVRGFQTERLKADGAVVPVDLTQTLLRAADGVLVGSSVILRDTTARLEAEAAIRRLNRELEDRVAERTAQLEALTEALRAKNDALTIANARLEALDGLKDEFVDLVSHELRAPLTNINASVELLLARPADAPTARKLEIIGEEASRLTRLVASVLDVSRMEAGRLELQVAPTDVAPLCRAAVARQSASHDWRVRVQPGLPAVLADADRAGEALGILLDNAARYSPAASPVDLDVRPAPEPGAVLFAVTDQGSGIPPEALERVFERFTRLEQGDARETYGHGLGLYIARKIVEAHGGRIWAESPPGRGATFLFTLPAAPEDA